MNRGKACSLVLEKWIKRRARFCSTSLGGGGTPYNGLHGGAPPERGTFFGPQVYERGGGLH